LLREKGEKVRKKTVSFLDGHIVRFEVATNGLVGPFDADTTHQAPVQSVNKNHSTILQCTDGLVGPFDADTTYQAPVQSNKQELFYNFTVYRWTGRSI
jgi:hypothetical protein